ncbi:MAG: nuclear transport factor 2 family protein [Rudaea sp.]|uniref:ketosteroid isomerase-related protein n=1 Tax=unclassified Rudaea TaxID=2627037 RepID=UPI0010F69201|nr:MULTISPECIES: ketosteroid isomerase-related protein [unclassified Rudaea]MBN8885424.1 nuclear transport factor 2 family protein [Rudaea sp.]MBR0346353.1 nuclear transport factor 2 family protein [Rudaea sp.]
MSNATVDLIRRYYAAFNAGDWDGMLGCLSEDVVHDINQGKHETGKPAFRAFLAHMERCYREQLRDIVVMAAENGDRGSAEFVVHGEYLATDEGLPPANGQKYVLPAGAFFDIRDGRITRVTNYYNLPNWTAQVVGP